MTRDDPGLAVSISRTAEKLFDSGRFEHMI
jgi:hypothetical protein